MEIGHLQANLTSNSSEAPKATLRTALQYLKGVGPERSRILFKLGLYSIGDLLHFFPRRYEDRSPIKMIRDMSLLERECVKGVVTSRGLIRTRTGQTILKVVLSDGRDTLFALWFNQSYLQKVFLPKSHVILYGKAEKQGKHIQMVHPEYEVLATDAPTRSIHSGRIVPIYPLTEDLSQKGIRLLSFRALEVFSSLLQDWMSTADRARLSLAERVWAFHQIHFPSSMPDQQKAYQRLVFDEFFLTQIVLEMKKAEFQKENKLLKHESGAEEVRKFVESLGFELTAGQAQSVKDILEDMSSGRVMNRLVQGDVGSGKTVVAAAALVLSAANGFQSALMAPTEVLAQQHYLKISQLLEPLGIRVGYLAQNLLASDKDDTLRSIADGSIQVVIGTHALIQQSVKFRRLGLAVIDEQHKFGVVQRAALKNKNADGPHFLLMTATPIPRTLTLTLYGDLDVSVIAELPKGRQPIRTYWVGENKREEIYKLLDRELSKGGQAYIICPLIDDKSPTDTKSVLEAHQQILGALAHRRVAVLHGRMKSDAKKKIMQEFKDKKVDILISTVVIEVGVDVPNANVMIIENAEKFGLAQLHQLRGRVGRGSTESYCVVFSDTMNEESVERLEAFQSTQSGFEIAEKDLQIRGGGDMIGEKQHGLPELRIGDLIKDMKLLEKAKKEARRIVTSDPKLVLAKHRGVKQALKDRFGYQAHRVAVSA